jgi:hypothetical protein
VHDGNRDDIASPLSIRVGDLTAHYDAHHLGQRLRGVATVVEPFERAEIVSIEDLGLTVTDPAEEAVRAGDAAAERVLVAPVGTPERDVVSRRGQVTDNEGTAIREVENSHLRRR